MTSEQRYLKGCSITSLELTWDEIKEFFTKLDSTSLWTLSILIFFDWQDTVTSTFQNCEQANTN